MWHCSAGRTGGCGGWDRKISIAAAADDDEAEAEDDDDDDDDAEVVVRMGNVIEAFAPEGSEPDGAVGGGG